MKLDQCEPVKVFKFFSEICNIPHGSGNEAALSAYLVKFAEDRGLWVHRDSADNVVIKKPGTPGYEHSPVVILQSHIDMVCEKNADTSHNFLTDPIKTVIEGDYIKADGTTLGADNGIGVAMALAVLDDTVMPHPPIEVLLTSDEEVGMIGANALDGSLLDGRLLINLDSEEEGEFFTSCAGGLKAKITIAAEYIPVNTLPYLIKVRGLKGGHSGLEIHKQRANANILLGRALHKLRGMVDTPIVRINGGLKDNAIPREAEALVMLDRKDVETAGKCLSDMEAVFVNEYAGSETGIKLLLEQSEEKPAQALTDEVCGKIISTILLIPDGVQYMSMQMQGLVEASNNLGVIRTQETGIEFNCALRSSVSSRKYFLADKLATLCSAVGVSAFELAHDYPAWEYRADSELRRKLCAVYNEMTGKEPLLAAVHAGLECGILAEKLKDVDIISFGPDISGAHTPEEKVCISSVERVYGFLKEALKSLK